MTDIPADIVPKFAKMDPKTEDIIPSGQGLSNGMVVLVVDTSIRAKVSEKMADWEEARALENNRWCMVSNLNLYRDLHENVEMVSFIATYGDGTKAQRRFNSSFAWFVKTDSIADSIQISTDRYRSTHAMVAALLRSVPPSDEDSFNEQVEEITKQLLKVL